MMLRKSMTVLAAAALIAFAVTIAQAGDGATPCRGMAQAGGSPQMQMKGAGCGHGQMNAADCAATCKQMGMAGCDMGQMQGGACCQGKMPADCCKGMMMGGMGKMPADCCKGKMMGGMGKMPADCCKGMMMGGMGKMPADCCKGMMMGGAAGCAMHGDKCNMDCMKMMQQGCGDACSMDDNGCNWSCDGIWGDYDCSNPGGRSLLNCGSRNSCRVMMFRGQGNDDDCMMMMRQMGRGKGGMKMMRRMDRREGGMKMMRMDGGCCAGGPKMERKVIMMHKHDGSCKPGCMGMEQGAHGSMPGCGMTPPPQMQHEGHPDTGK